MKVFEHPSYEALSRQMTDDLLKLLKDRENPLLCTASGDSPAGLYKEIVNRVRKKELDTSNWSFVGLDEWVGMNGDDEGSCRYHLDQQLFNPLQVPTSQLCFFDGRAHDTNAECNRVEKFISEHDGIDIAIVGLGMNGHIGMNEPGTSPDLYAHVTDLDPLTIQVGQKYFTQQQPLTKGITLGIADLMQARHVFLVVSGGHKAIITKKALHGPLSKEVPASLLRDHANLHVYLDEQAAALI